MKIGFEDVPLERAVPRGTARGGCEAGDKLMEINVFSPRGIGVAERLTGVNFAEPVIADLERKVMARSLYGPRLTNVEIATL